MFETLVASMKGAMPVKDAFPSGIHLKELPQAFLQFMNNKQAEHNAEQVARKQHQGALQNIMTPAQQPNVSQQPIGQPIAPATVPMQMPQAQPQAPLPNFTIPLSVFGPPR